MGTCAMSNGYLRDVRRLVEVALVQTGRVTRCEHHNDVLLHMGDGGAEDHVVYNRVSVWLKDEHSLVMREDVDDAIKDVLDCAAKDGCPECARLEDI